MSVDKIRGLSHTKRVAVYRKLREDMAAEKKELEAKQRDRKQLMKDIEMVFKEEMLETGTQSIKTANGTAYMSRVGSVTAPDWDAFINWVRAKDRWDMLERRPSKSEVMQYAEETGGDLPAGVDFTMITKVNIRG